MYRIARALVVMLAISLLASCLFVNVTADDGSGTKASTPVVSGDLSIISDGTTYNFHRLTASDVESFRSIMGTKDLNTDYNLQLGGFGTGLAPPSELDYEQMEGSYVLTSTSAADLTATLPSSLRPFHIWFVPGRGQPGLTRLLRRLGPYILCVRLHGSGG